MKIELEINNMIGNKNIDYQDSQDIDLIIAIEELNTMIWEIRGNLYKNEQMQKETTEKQT